jgi:hypothetical protein
MVTGKGQYSGHWLGKTLEGLPSEVAAKWHDPHQGWRHQFEESAQRVGKALAAKGYRGPVGIDGFIYKNHDEVHFQSLSEINPRFTMGRIALEISKHCIAKTPGVWLHLSLGDITKSGYESFEDFALKAKQKFPLKCKIHSSSHRQLESGVLMTNDPAVAKRFLTVLVLASSGDELAHMLGELNLRVKHPAQ